MVTHATHALYKCLFGEIPLAHSKEDEVFHSNHREKILASCSRASEASNTDKPRA